MGNLETNLASCFDVVIQSASHLYALAHGADCIGPERCFYCGAACDGSNPTSEHVKPSFTGWPTVAAPQSRSVCNGCVLSMRDAMDVPVIDGTVKPTLRCAVRSYSWIVTRSSAVAASKAHMATLRALCLDPPAPPYAIVLSDSGQTHQIYRATVGRSAFRATVNLECERIEYSRDELTDAMETTMRLAACVGKPGLSEPSWSAAVAARIFDRYRDAEALIDRWRRMRGSPIGRLAVWLTPKMEDCRLVHPSDFD